MAREEQYETAGIELPDMFEFECNGHWVNVINNYDRNKIKIYFMTPHDREVTVTLSMKDVKDLRKELKAAQKLVEIAEDY